MGDQDPNKLKGKGKVPESDEVDRRLWRDLVAKYGDGDDNRSAVATGALRILGTGPENPHQYAPQPAPFVNQQHGRPMGQQSSSRHDVGLPLHAPPTSGNLPLQFQGTNPPPSQREEWAWAKKMAERMMDTRLRFGPAYTPVPRRPQQQIQDNPGQNPSPAAPAVPNSEWDKVKRKSRLQEIRIRQQVLQLLRQQREPPTGPSAFQNLPPALQGPPQAPVRPAASGALQIQGVRPDVVQQQPQAYDPYQIQDNPGQNPPPAAPVVEPFRWSPAFQNLRPDLQRPPQAADLPPQRYDQIHPLLPQQQHLQPPPPVGAGAQQQQLQNQPAAGNQPVGGQHGEAPGGYAAQLGHQGLQLQEQTGPALPADQLGHQGLQLQEQAVLCRFCGNPAPEGHYPLKHDCVCGPCSIAENTFCPVCHYMA